jgi:hypothetical protein
MKKMVGANNQPIAGKESQPNANQMLHRRTMESATLIVKSERTLTFTQASASVDAKMVMKCVTTFLKE